MASEQTQQLNQKWDAQVNGMVALQSTLDAGTTDVEAEKAAVQQWDQNIHQLIALKVSVMSKRSL